MSFFSVSQLLQDEQLPYLVNHELLPVSETQSCSGFPREGCTKSGTLTQPWFIWLSLPGVLCQAFKDLLGQGVLGCEQLESWICNLASLCFVLSMSTSHPSHLTSYIVFTICGTVGNDKIKEVFAALRLIFMESLPTCDLNMTKIFLYSMVCFGANTCPNCTSEAWLSPHPSVWLPPVYFFLYNWEIHPSPMECVHNHVYEWATRISALSLKSNSPKSLSSSAFSGFWGRRWCFPSAWKANYSGMQYAIRY